MGKKLVIVESPAKAKTIGRYLGPEYKIAASVGHIRDLPSSTLGVNVNDNYKPTYINMRGKEKVIKELKELAKDSEFVYLATDPDREGEAIAWHIAKSLSIDPTTDCRIFFNEITKKAIQESISKPRGVDLDLVNAQQARRILDRLVGYELSPLLWQKIKKGLSAGRVQSVATKIVMDRDTKIDEFVSEEYWLVNAIVCPKGTNFKFKIKYHGSISGSKITKKKLSNKQEADAVLEDVKGKDYTVANLKKGTKEISPFPPFTTSTLQQEASKRLGFSSRKTMSVAQQLYEGINIQGQGQTALVSYIRTDSVRISEEASEASRLLIASVYGKEYVSNTKRKFKINNSAQDAHEAIRPTHFDLRPESIHDSLSNDQYRLYKLIWDRFLSTQMTNAVVDTVSIDAVCGSSVFRANGETIVFPGFLAAYADITEDAEDKIDNEKDSSVKLPELSDGQILANIETTSEMKHTLPPAHYTEATLIKALEENGIGRPSTYAPTISTILERQYVEKDGRHIKITELGKLVTVLLNNNFSEIVDVSFTADMEKRLDEIEVGKTEWTQVIDAFYPGFHKQILEATKSIEKIKVKEEKIGEKCPLCNEGNLLQKEGRYGKFIACSNFPKCNYTRGNEIEVNGKCPLCGSGLMAHKSRKYKGKMFYTCDKKGANSECTFISWDLPVEDKKCETCGSYMVWKKYRGRSYTKCSNKECSTNIRKKKEDSSIKTTDDSSAEG